MNPKNWPLPGQLLLSLAAGGATVLAFAPFSLGFVAVLTLALLFHLWRHVADAAGAAGLGFAFGLGLMAFGVFWLRISIAQFGGVTPPLAVTVTVLFALFMACYFAVAGWLARRLRPRSDIAWVLLVMPAVWVLVEWLRGWLLTGFPWLSLGYSQVDLPLAGLAPVLGVFGVSLGVAVSAALLTLLPGVVAIGGLAALWAAAFGLQQVAWIEPAADPVRVSLLQASIPQAQKWQPSMRRETLETYLDMTASVADSRIVIWPETAVPAFASEMEQGLLQPLHDMLSAQGRDVVLGIVDGQRAGEYFNAMLSLGASGRDRYHKRHLVPFGEYLPLDAWTRPVLDFLDIPMSDFTPGGDRSPIITLGGQPVGINICYEDAYADEVIRALPQATLLINTSNDAWFGDSLAPHQHLEIARMRAVETGRYLLRATNTGISAIIDQRGKLLALSPQFEPAVLGGEVLPLRGATPFVSWGNTAVLLLALSMLAPALAQRLSRSS
ncbi:MAG: apolipoprotein N-acyltransferase [Gammaproteobacteria bacterium]|nr:apolipoprotein N-acyltransferase [Gammaproteobacteria bacterium]